MRDKKSKARKDGEAERRGVVTKLAAIWCPRDGLLAYKALGDSAQ